MVTRGKYTLHWCFSLYARNHWRLKLKDTTTFGVTLSGILMLFCCTHLLPEIAWKHFISNNIKTRKTYNHYKKIKAVWHLKAIWSLCCTTSHYWAHTKRINLVFTLPNLLNLSLHIILTINTLQKTAWFMPCHSVISINPLTYKSAWAIFSHV